MKTVLSFHSHVAGARVGHSVSAFAMERLGVTVLQMPTVLYGRRPDRGKPGGGPMPATLLGAMLEGLRDDGRLATVDAVHCGYLALPEQIAVVMEAADRVRSVNKAAVFVVDPVIGDAERGLYVPQQVAEGVAETMVREADWITPNAWELARIVGRDSLDLQGLRQAARRLGKPMLVTSAPADQGIGALYAASAGDWLVETPRLPMEAKGAGDLFTALFLARRLLGSAPAVALEAAAGSVYDVLVQQLALATPDLPLPAAQELLADPLTWPIAKPLPPLA
jgi:pyridoxine kinase